MGTLTTPDPRGTANGCDVLTSDDAAVAAATPPSEDPAPTGGSATAGSAPAGSVAAGPATGTRSLPAAPAAQPRRAWVEQIMGMPISVHLRGPGTFTDTAAGQVAEFFADLRRVDETFSTYRPGSEVSRVNRGELELDDCSAQVREVVDLCRQAGERTGGWFDAWLPGPDGQPRFDPAGLVKGWGVEWAARHLTGLSDVDLCLNAGGDVLVRCRMGSPSWRIGIEDPNDPSQVLRVVSRAHGAVATSGSTHRGAHLIDPHTGRPAVDVHAVTVTGPSLMWADVFATAAAVRGVDALSWLDHVVGYEALMVGASRMVITTSRWASGF